MKRVVPEQFPEKFRNHEVLPTRCAFITEDRCQCYACALGIEAIDGSDVVSAMNARHNIGELACLSQFPLHYAKGLSDGWEGDRPIAVYSGDAEEQYLQGQADGKAAFEACQAAGLFD